MAKKRFSGSPDLSAWITIAVAGGVALIAILLIAYSTFNLVQNIRSTNLSEAAMTASAEPTITPTPPPIPTNSPVPIPTLGEPEIPGIDTTPASVPTPVIQVSEDGLWVVAQPTEINDLLLNPDIGWQDTNPARPRFPQAVAYRRVEWVDLNPAEGVYDWSLFDSMRDMAMGISFGIKTASTPPFGSGQAVPQWVIDKGAQMVYTYEVSSEEANEPVYHNCVFLEEHARFINALREKYDGDPKVVFIDIRSYGYFGEWHTPQYNEDENSLDFHARVRIMEMYIGGSGTRPCSLADGTISRVTYNYPGFQSTQLVYSYTPYFEQTLVWAFQNRRQDIGIRQDALGSPSHQDTYREQIGSIVQAIWTREPIIFEFSANGWTDENLISARAFIQEMHGSIVHDNFPGKGNEELLVQLLNVTGYRLVLREIRHQRSATPGGQLTLDMIWQNVGSAPPYRAFPLIVALLNAQGEVAASWQMQTDVTTWLPGGPIGIGEQTVTLPSDLPPGTYTVAVAFVWPGTTQPALQLGIAGRDGATGYYHVSLLEVTD